MNLSGLSRCVASFSRLRSAVTVLLLKAVYHGGCRRPLRAAEPQRGPFLTCGGIEPFARAGQQGLWRNSSASDSRSEGWEFESLWPQSMHRKLQQVALSGRSVVAKGFLPWWLPLEYEAREIRTPNLLIWSQTRCRCAIAPSDPDLLTALAQQVHDYGPCQVVQAGAACVAMPFSQQRLAVALHTGSDQLPVLHGRGRRSAGGCRWNMRPERFELPTF